MSEIVLKMKEIQKQFSGVYALKSAAFELQKGEVHALMGENGAGKSTLMKILCGIYTYDNGQIELFGNNVNFKNIRESQKAGISIIHQELNMMNHLTVAQNIFIGREPIKNGTYIDDFKMEEETRKLFKKIGMNVSPSAKLGSLTVGKQQMVEIAKAISHNSKILILDEPTAALTQPEVEELFKIMNDLKKKGIAMIYISHRMDEIERISDRVTVMRDGEYIGTLTTKNTTKDEIIKMMVGRVILGEEKKQSNVKSDAQVVLEVKN
ncbi:MAG: sugar ABC transporter ATP-binding protein, partial [Clostridia bacterium]|nr:sugar ABC transporter ATP-binding protein [Clostridia bacterium]